MSWWKQERRSEPVTPAPKFGFGPPYRVRLGSVPYAAGIGSFWMDLKETFPTYEQAEAAIPCVIKRIQRQGGILGTRGDYMPLARLASVAVGGTWQEIKPDAQA